MMIQITNGVSVSNNTSAAHVRKPACCLDMISNYPLHATGLRPAPERRRQASLVHPVTELRAAIISELWQAMCIDDARKAGRS